MNPVVSEANLFLRMRSVLTSVVAGDLHWPVSLPQHVVAGTCLRDELRCLRGSLDCRDTGVKGLQPRFGGRVAIQCLYPERSVSRASCSFQPRMF